jgi:hypothetical protein
MQPERTFQRAYSPQHKEQRVTDLMQGARRAASDGVRREPTRPPVSPQDVNRHGHR